MEQACSRLILGASHVPYDVEKWVNLTFIDSGAICFFTLQVGFNMRKVTKGGIVIKLWDLGGQVCKRSWASKLS